MVDLIYLAHNRLEFTKASFEALRLNTDWTEVNHHTVYDDASFDGTTEFLLQQFFAPTRGRWGSPVAILNDAIRHSKAEFIAKIDSDTMVPPGWLNACLDIMRAHPDLEMLGIEAFNDVVDGTVPRSYTPARFIGGIGLFRRSAFKTLPTPDGRFGFGSWQEQNHITCGWINPSLPVCLLNRIPIEPWKSLSAKYVAMGWQRDWPEPYRPDQSYLWEWF